jgi:Bacterial Ig domain
VTTPPPTTLDDQYFVVSGTQLTVAAPGVLGNDNRNGGGALTALLVTPPSNGTLALAASGGFTYVPNGGFVGTDGFSYRAVSSVGPGNTALVTLNVRSDSPVQPPTNLYVASVVGNTVTVRWTPPTTGLTPTSFVLEGGLTPGAPLAFLPTGVAPIHTFQAPTGSFYIRVRSIAGAERSDPSNEVQLFVNVPIGPSAPANLLGLVNGSSLALAWRNTFGGAAPTGLLLDVSGPVNLSLPLGLTETFNFNNVPPGTYTLSLRAFNAAGTSTPSNPVTLTFPLPCQGPPETPSNFLAYRVGNTLIVLWDPAATGTAPTSYLVNVTGASIASIPTPTRSLSGGVGPGSYTLSVVAVNACGGSAPTAVQTVIVP